VGKREGKWREGMEEEEGINGGALGLWKGEGKWRVAIGSCTGKTDGG
jgi:hypothetical protein